MKLGTANVLRILGIISTLEIIHPVSFCFHPQSLNCEITEQSLCHFVVCRVILQYENLGILG